MNLAKLKQLAEKHKHITYRTESPELQEDVEWLIAANPQTILNLINKLETATDALKIIDEHLNQVWNAGSLDADLINSTVMNTLSDLKKDL